MQTNCRVFQTQSSYIKSGANNILKNLTGVINMKFYAWRGIGLAFTLSLMLAVVVGVGTLMVPAAVAQTSDGTIVGTVTDSSGAAVPKAKVTATSKELGAERSTVTDSAGGYRIENLLPGTYTVSVEANGFTHFELAGIHVKGSLEVSANAQLQVGSMSSTVTVEATSAQELQTESGSLGAEISQQEVHDLPIQGGNPIALVLTQPGVQDGNGMSFSNGVGFSVNGTRPRANNFLIDGQDNNDNSINGQAFQTTNLGDIQEVTILTNSYSAEFGRGGGSVTNEITRGGTNVYHGEAWEQNRNSAFAAISPQAALGGITKNPQDNENIFGFNFGGPVKRNKLFFFGTGQWDRDFSASAAAAAPITIPTAAGIATLTSLLPNPNVQLLLNSLGGLVAPVSNGKPIALGPNAAGIDRGSVDVGDFVRSQGSIVSLTREWETRVDYNPTDVDSFRASYRRADASLTPDFFNFPTNLPPFDTQQGGPSQAFTTIWNHTFSARTLNELRFSYSNIDFSFSPTAASLANPLANTPGISIANSGLPGLGIPTGIPQFRGHKSYQFQDALTYTLGRHTFTFGGDIDYLQVDDGIPFNSRGTIAYQASPASAIGVTPVVPAFTSLGNFVDDFSGSSGAVSINFGNPEVQPFVGNYAPYVQDTWHLKPNFTVNLGLRYEYWGTIGNIVPFPSINTQELTFGVAGAVFPNFLATKQQGDKNNFAPRVGLAWTPKFWQRFLGQDKTVIRAGGGMFYDGIFTNILDNTGSTVPNVNGGTLTATSANSGIRGLAGASSLLTGLSPVADPQATMDTMASHILNPLTFQWNLDIQRELPGGFIMTTAYVGNRGEHLFTNQDYNFVDGNTGLRLNPNLGEVLVRDNAGDSNYNSGQLTLDRKFSHGLLLRGAYTYSKFIDDTSEVFTSTGLSSFSQNLLNQKADYGLSAYDRRHRFVMTYIWDLPYPHGGDNMGMKVLSQVVRGWQWAGTATVQSGAPETIADGFDVNGDGHANDRPNLGSMSAPFSSIGIDGTQVGLAATPGTFFGPIQACLSSEPAQEALCVAQPASSFRYLFQASGFGNVGRNTFIGPGQMYYDTSIQRSFKFLERQSVTLRVELFNAFNHPNLFTDGGVNSYDLLSPNFGNIASTIDGNRSIKFWLKYAF
ncbi:MAG: TonB-dependent receptor [Candidatus Acidiferrum sp.]